jgi:hypothetical protein
MNELDDDDFNHCFAELTEEEMGVALQGMETMTKEEYDRMVLESMLHSYDNASQPLKPRPFDAITAMGIVESNKEAQLLRELTNVENKIRDAAYDRETAITCSNLFPETVKELKARGFSVKERRSQFLDDPAMWHRSESTATAVYYLISWNREGCLQ